MKLLLLLIMMMMMMMMWDICLGAPSEFTEE